MRRALVVKARRFVRDERGQVLPFLALAMATLLATCGIAVDVGRCLYLHRQLQAATDAAALAGAQGLPQTSATATAISYSAVAGNLNARTSLQGATMVSGYPQAVCLQTLQSQGMACSAPANANAMVVREQLPVTLYFLRVIGINTITIGAVATASMRGASPVPYNIAIIIDGTLSMDEYDSDCGATQMSCALNGVRVLLQALTPCATSQATCSISNGVSSNSVDRVALFTFPNITVGSASVNTNCTSPITQAAANQYGYQYSSNPPIGYYSMRNETPWSGLAQAVSYTYPSSSGTSYNPSGSTTGTYAVTGFLSDYKTSDTATSLNTNSALVKAAGGGSGNCGGLASPNYSGDYGTYYAGALYAAMGALLAEQSSFPQSQNVIIFLSDGDANAPQNNGSISVMPSPATGNGSYPSYADECIQGYYAAQAAANQGIRVYTVSYGSETAGCSTDPSSYEGVPVNPCTVMEYMASAPQYFYSDYNQSGSNSSCYSSAQPVTSLSGIFNSIAGDLTVARLIPDNTT